MLAVGAIIVTNSDERELMTGARAISGRYRIISAGAEVHADRAFGIGPRPIACRASETVNAFAIVIPVGSNNLAPIENGEAIGFTETVVVVDRSG